MLLIILQWTGQPPLPPAQNVNAVQAEKPCSYHFTCVISSKVLTTPWGGGVVIIPFTDEETEAKNHCTAHPRPHSLQH